MADQFNILDRAASTELVPTGGIAQTFNRYMPLSDLAMLTSGTLHIVGLYLPAGSLVSSISFRSRTTAAVSPTNQWFGLFDSGLGKLALTADDTSTAWGANTKKTLNLSAAYRTTYSGLHYCGILVVAATPPSLLGVNAATAFVLGETPILNRASSTSLTDPASCPATVTGGSSSSNVPYAYVS